MCCLPCPGVRWINRHAVRPRCSGHPIGPPFTFLLGAVVASLAERLPVRPVPEDRSVIAVADAVVDDRSRRKPPLVGAHDAAWIGDEEDFGGSLPATTVGFGAVTELASGHEKSRPGAAASERMS